MQRNYLTTFFKIHDPYWTSQHSLTPLDCSVHKLQILIISYYLLYDQHNL